ncbi:hypothetical protein [Flavobacterium sp.]|jgi:hypothetical protein|uniref:hypothetical protein n=1 Tax=Flavobacterium sp. TaxID=239 RepID=UPI003BC06951
MQSKIDQLISAFESVVNEPWTTSLSGQERIWFLVYDPAEQRKVDLRIGDFETTTIKAKKRWISISLKNCFPLWMSNHEYKEEYFNDPESLVDQLEAEFKLFAINYIITEFEKLGTDENTLIAIKDISSLFGFNRLSDVLSGCSNYFKGRVLLFFPGEYDKNQYRLLDARDGWNYLARPITA